ncbi:MAG: anthranilate synthase component I family protein [Victivallaceae bacterium]|nr:anthranilate synthase component I family protein [Victivallaceae bacterium]
MYKPDFKEFKELAKRGNVVPVYQDMLADLETPVSVLNRFMDHEHVALFESVEGGERWGRYSVIGINPFGIFQVTKGVPSYTEHGKTEILDASNGAFFALRQILKRYQVVQVPGMPRFFAGALGYLGYNAIAEFEKMPEPKRPLTEQTAYFMLLNQAVVFDNVTHTMRLVSCAQINEGDDARKVYDRACKQITELKNQLEKPHPIEKSVGSFDPADIKSNMTREYFNEMAAKAKEYITAGEIIQVVLSQRFTAPTKASPIQLYRALRLINPSPYMIFLKTAPDKYLIGSSPEVMVRLNNGKATVRPIAGTRPRGKDDASDRHNANDLLSDEKERAEHLMLVDLGRNDLSRVAQPGSVQVRELMIVERYSHVMHLVSNVECMVEPDKDAFDLIKATFPAGTLSGAPKIRAMEIINELEPEPREVYGGAIGYIGFDGNMDMAITIRTMEVRDGVIAVQAGGGHVYDSDPDYEFNETKHKASALFKAVELAIRNLEI